MANKSETLSFRVPDTVYDRIYEIAKADRRKLSEVALGILERGLAAYDRDGQIFEPSPIGHHPNNQVDSQLPLPPVTEASGMLMSRGEPTASKHGSSGSKKAATKARNHAKDMKINKTKG